MACARMIAGCLLAVPTGCVHKVPPDLFSDTGPDIIVRRMQVEQHGSAIPATFWNAVSQLDVAAARARASTISERFFTDGLNDLVTGNMTGAEVLFHTLLADPDPLLAGRSRIGLTIALSAQGKWHQLAELGPAASAVEAADDAAYVTTLTDRAAIDSWAGVLRDVPPVEVDAPAAAVTLPILGSMVGTPIIQVQVNGHTHYFWLDTGATMSLLSADVAKESGIAPLSGDTLAIAAAHGRIAARPAVADLVRIGTVLIRHLPVALLDPGSLRLDRRMEGGRVVPVELDGVIGSDVLRRLSVVLDMGARTISLARPAARAPGRRNLLWIGFPVVRLLARDGRPVLFGIDTGADSTIVTDAWMALTPDPGLASIEARVDALGATHASGLPVVRRVIAGDGDYVLRLTNVPVVGERQQTFVALDGVLGADVLAHATLRMDITNGIFSIRAPGAPSFPRDTSLVKERP